jgi:hypothetical protein
MLNCRTFPAVDLLRVVQGKRQIAIGAKPLPLCPPHVLLIALVPASPVRLEDLKMEIEFCDDEFKAVRIVLIGSYRRYGKAVCLHLQDLSAPRSVLRH